MVLLIIISALLNAVLADETTIESPASDDGDSAANSATDTVEQRANYNTQNIRFRGTIRDLRREKIKYLQIKRDISTAGLEE